MVVHLKIVKLLLEVGLLGPHGLLPLEHLFLLGDDVDPVVESLELLEVLDEVVHQSGDPAVVPFEGEIENEDLKKLSVADKVVLVELGARLLPLPLLDDLQELEDLRDDEVLLEVDLELRGNGPEVFVTLRRN